jgi:hypothetical protein
LEEERTFHLCQLFHLLYKCPEEHRFQAAGKNERKKARKRERKKERKKERREKEKKKNPGKLPGRSTTSL